jgi:hypothetical protein
VSSGEVSELTLWVSRKPQRKYRAREGGCDIGDFCASHPGDAPRTGQPSSRRCWPPTNQVRLPSSIRLMRFTPKIYTQLRIIRWSLVQVPPAHVWLVILDQFIGGPVSTTRLT